MSSLSLLAVSKTRLKFAIAAAFLFCAVAAFAQQKLAPIPSATVRVNDNASMLTEGQAAKLDRLFDEYEKSHKTRLLLLTVASTSPEEVDRYAERVAEAWKIGQPGGAGDVVILVARTNTSDLGRVKIAARPDLQGVLSDDLMARVVAEDILPPFQYLDYYGGLVAGFERIKFLIGGGVMPPPPVEVVATPEAPPLLDRNVVIAAGLFVLIMLLLLFRHATRRRMSYLAGDRAINRAFSPMIVGGFVGRTRDVDIHEGNGFGGGYVGPGVGGYAGGGGDFSGGSASGKW
jgi:uncharacterized protein